MLRRSAVMHITGKNPALASLPESKFALSNSS